MNKDHSRWLKALFLLATFSLNTVVGVACSVSIFVHNNHHPKTTQGSGHSHEHGKAGSNHGHDKHKHGHDEPTDNQTDEKGKCCSTAVVILDKLDKSVTKHIYAPLFLTYVEIFKASGIDFFSQEIGMCKFLPQRFRWTPTTIPDIRIAIQSFQI